MQKHKKKYIGSHRYPINNIKRKLKFRGKRRLRYLFKKYFASYRFKKNIFNRKITIRLVKNNVFCTLINLKTKKIITIGSAGKYRIYISKKKLKKNIIRILRSFIRESKKKLTKKGLIIDIIAPIKIRKKILRFIKILRSYQLKKKPRRLYYRALLIKLISLKCFNGCRASKKRRKKRKGLRVFKY